jgi:D-alanyl-D-alanine carboxypeptidase
VLVFALALLAGATAACGDTATATDEGGDTGADADAGGDGPGDQPDTPPGGDDATDPAPDAADATDASADTAAPGDAAPADAAADIDALDAAATDSGDEPNDAASDTAQDAALDDSGDVAVDVVADVPADAPVDAVADVAADVAPDVVVEPTCAAAADLEAMTTAELARQGISGVALGVDMPDCRWTDAAGIADRAASAEMTRDNRFRIASITKTFTAAIVLQLVDEGAIALTDTLDEFVEFPAGDTIMIENLLAHSSGIPDYFNRAEVESRYLDVWTHEQVIDIARGLPLEFAPGSRHQYSNTNFYLLGMVIESVTGHTYESELRTRLLVPLGLDDTLLATATSSDAGLARGYEETDDVFVDVTDAVDPSLTWAAGGIISTVDDLVTFERALLVGDLLSDATRLEMLTPVALPGGITSPYGLGIAIQTLPRGLGLFYSHLGRLPGYYGMVGYLVESNQITVELTNDTNGGPNPFMTGAWGVLGML